MCLFKWSTQFKTTIFGQILQVTEQQGEKSDEELLTNSTMEIGGLFGHQGSVLVFIVIFWFFFLQLKCVVCL